MNLNSVVAPAKDSLAVITGGSRGIGAELIRVFAANGYHIATYGRNEQRLKQLKQEIERTFKVQLNYSLIDAASAQAVREFGNWCLNLGPQVRVLINNAGQFIPGNLMEEKEGGLRQMLSLNLESAYELSRVIVPVMKSKKTGHIINICSVASLKAYPAGGSYAISKAGLMSFSQNLREELKSHGVRVTAVYPGATWTDSWAGSGYPQERFIPVGDLAKIVWNCHDLSEHTVVEDIILRPQLGDL